MLRRTGKPDKDVGNAHSSASIVKSDLLGPQRGNDVDDSSGSLPSAMPVHFRHDDVGETDRHPDDDDRRHDIKSNSHRS
jgi:hypothetical protein